MLDEKIKGLCFPDPVVTTLVQHNDTPPIVEITGWQALHGKGRDRKPPPEAARSRNTGKAMEQPARSRAKTRGPGSPETQTARPAPQGQAAGAPPPEPPDTRGKRPDNAAGQGHARRTPQARRRAEGKKNPRPRGEGCHEDKKKSRQLPTFPRSGVSSA